MVESTLELKGYDNFKRHNPRSDKFAVHRFHHVEFWCSDATNVCKRFQHGLGMSLIAKSDQSTGNSTFASYVLQSNDLVFTFTAPYSKTVAHNSTPGSVPLPTYDQDTAFKFIISHGLAVRAMGIAVADAAEAFRVSVENGAKPVTKPVTLKAHAEDGQQGEQTIAEVMLYGDVVLRYVSGTYQGPYLAGYVPVTTAPHIGYGIKRLDHAVGNVPVLADAAAYIMKFTGFHEFAEFVAEDVGTLDSGLNSVVLASNNEYVLLPVNEPTFGTPRKSQIQTFLEQNEGPGLQHLALKTDDIFHTLREMQARSEYGGFEFMPRPSDKYYKELPDKVGDALTPRQLAECKELGILVDKDDQGILLQIFTKPLGDRPTVFIEIIQRLGCMSKQSNGTTAQGTTASSTAPSSTTSAPTGTNGHPPVTAAAVGAAEGAEIFAGLGGSHLLDPPTSLADAAKAGGTDGSVGANGHSHPPGPPNEEQAAGCGGFGKGNFSELFKRIEDYERTLNI